MIAQCPPRCRRLEELSQKVPRCVFSQFCPTGNSLIVESARSKTFSLVQIRFNLPAAVEKHYTASHFPTSAPKNAFDIKNAMPSTDGPHRRKRRIAELTEQIRSSYPCARNRLNRVLSGREPRFTMSSIASTASGSPSGCPSAHAWIWGRGVLGRRIGRPLAPRSAAREAALDRRARLMPRGRPAGAR